MDDGLSATHLSLRIEMEPVREQLRTLDAAVSRRAVAADAPSDLDKERA
jgi:hypothetical protein